MKCADFQFNMKWHIRSAITLVLHWRLAESNITVVPWVMRMDWSCWCHNYMADVVPPSTDLAFDRSDKHNSASPSAIQIKMGKRQSVLKTDVINKPEKGEWIDISDNFLLLTACMFERSTYLPTHAIHHAIYITYIQTPTCFSTHIPSSWSYHKQDVQANLLIYVLFIVISLIKTLVAKIHKMYTINKIDIRVKRDKPTGCN